MKKALIILVGFLAVSGCSKMGCQRDEGEKVLTYTPRGSQNEDEHSRVQHILIAFQGSLPGKNIERTKADAEKLAEEIYQKALANPSEFDALVRQYSDDQPPGVYELANFSREPKGLEYPRGEMVPDFGGMAFALKVGEIGLVKYDKVKSPWGFHIMMRLPDSPDAETPAKPPEISEVTSGTGFAQKASVRIGRLAIFLIIFPTLGFARSACDRAMAIAGESKVPDIRLIRNALTLAKHDRLAKRDSDFLGGADFLKDHLVMQALLSNASNFVKKSEDMDVETRIAYMANFEKLQLALRQGFRSPAAYQKFLVALKSLLHLEQQYELLIDRPSPIRLVLNARLDLMLDGTMDMPKDKTGKPENLGFSRETLPTEQQRAGYLEKERRQVLDEILKYFQKRRKISLSVRVAPKSDPGPSLERRASSSPRRLQLAQ